MMRHRKDNGPSSQSDRGSDSAGGQADAGQLIACKKCGHQNCVHVSVPWFLAQEQPRHSRVLALCMLHAL